MEVKFVAHTHTHTSTHARTHICSQDNSHSTRKILGDLCQTIVSCTSLQSRHRHHRRFLNVGSNSTFSKQLGFTTIYLKQHLRLFFISSLFFLRVKEPRRL